jgi:glutathionyl-hydroquinone reductase
MGYLESGKWTDGWFDTKKTGGAFVRPDSTFRNAITADGSSAFPAEAGRYHLYVALSCPWAHRTLITRKLKRLEKAISISIVDVHMGSDGWVFSDAPGTIPDTLYGFKFLHQVYTKADPDYTGRVTVPTLWDKKAETIVNNESSEIIRMFNTAFDGLGGGIGNPDLDLYPKPLRVEINAVNDRVYNNINNGVYKAGFATSQSAYEAAFDALFEALDEMEERLGKHRYIVGNQLTEADIRFFTTLVRFDAVYQYHFKCNLRRIEDYPNLSNYLRDLYQTPGFGETVNMDHIKRHYYGSHETINPSGIVPKGPLLDFSRPHDRARFSN